MKPHLQSIRIGLLAGTLAGCAAVGPDYRAPEGTTDDRWSGRVADELATQPPTIESWWTLFGDPALDDLVDRARASNPDLMAATARIREARAARGVARSAFFPQVDATGEAIRARTSESLGLPIPDNPSNQFSSGFDAGWEIDIFGGVRRAVESTEAAYESEIEGYRDALVSLFAEVGLNYIDLRTLEERLAFARSNIEAQRGSVGLTRNRLEAGLAADLDVSQAESNLAISEALVPQLEEQIGLARNRLATLAGVFPGQIDDVLARRRGIPATSRRVGLGLPADLLRNRADIRRAERVLAAQVAQIGVATADLYPRFGLGGTLALAASDADDLLDASSRTWGFGPAFRWQIFNAGRVRSFIEVEAARAEQAFHAYEKAVLAGIEEVESALVALEKERVRRSKLDEAVAKTRRTVELTKSNYTTGLVGFQSVLDAERSLFNVQDEAAASAGQVSKNLVRLFKALGGGWDLENPNAPVK